MSRIRSDYRPSGPDSTRQLMRCCHPHPRPIPPSPLGVFDTALADSQVTEITLAGKAGAVLRR